MVVLGLVLGDFGNWPLHLAVLVVLVLVWPFHIPLADGVEIYVGVRWVGAAAAYVLGVAALPVFWISAIPGFVFLAVLDRVGWVKAHGLAAENLKRLRGEPVDPGSLVEGNLRSFMNLSSHLLRATILGASRLVAPDVPLLVPVAIAEMVVASWNWMAPVPGRMAPERMRARFASILGPDMLLVIPLLDFVMVWFLLLSHVYGGGVGLVAASLSTLVLHAILGRLNETRLESERQRQQLVDMREELSRRERLAAIGQTASTVFHQIAREHGAIGMYAHLLQRGTHDDGNAPADCGSTPSVRQHAERILASVQEANRVIDELLRFGQDRTLNLYPQSLAELVTESISNCQPRAAAQAVQVDMAGVVDATVVVDKHKVKQALGNLLDNAIDASPRGGSVYVRTKLTDVAVRIAVQDEGAGIPTEFRERLFTPFCTTKPKGIGLGLPLAKELVEAHGGTVECRPAEPGTVFTIILPRSLSG